ncbi:hypothetical protein J7K93_06785 [bacterium]|nr:hypothetical protein [bacterium]
MPANNSLFYFFFAFSACVARDLSNPDAGEKVSKKRFYVDNFLKVT